MTRPPVDVSTLTDRVWAFAVLSTVAHLALGSSTVGLNLWVIQGVTSSALAGLYAFVLAAIVIDPDRPGLHSSAAVFGVAFWLGRLGGFLDLVFQGRTDLLPAVHERAMIVLMILLWHLRAVRAIAVRMNFADR